MTHARACARTACARGKGRWLKYWFIAVVFHAVFALRQQIAKLSGFSAVQARLAAADDLDHTQPNKRARDRMRFLVAQSFTSFSRVSVTQEISAVGRQTM